MLSRDVCKAVQTHWTRFFPEFLFHQRNLRSSSMFHIASFIFLSFGLCSLVLVQGKRARGLLRIPLARVSIYFGTTYDNCLPATKKVWTVALGRIKWLHPIVALFVFDIDSVECTQTTQCVVYAVDRDHTVRGIYTQVKLSTFLWHNKSPYSQIKYKKSSIPSYVQSSISSSALLHHHSSASTKHYTKEALASPSIQNEDHHPSLSHGTPRHSHSTKLHSYPLLLRLYSTRDW